MPRKLLQIILPLFTGALVLAAWYGIHGYLSDEMKFLLPTPGAILNAFSVNSDALARATLVTAKGAFLGFIIAVAISSFFAVLLSLSPLVRVSLYPYLLILQLTPVIVFAPVLVIWVGAGLKSVTIITFIICLFPLIVNTTQGLISTDRNLVELFAMWRTSRAHQILHLRIPAALPYFFTGLRIAATLAPLGAVVGDYTAGSSGDDGGGLGFQAIIYSTQARYSALFATAAIACALGFVFTGIVNGLSWLALHKWHDSYERTDK